MGTVTQKILLAEGDRFLRRACEISLRQLGYTVLLAADGEEALGLIYAELPDLVLLHVLMPKMSGIKVLENIRANDKTKALPVLVLTNCLRERDIKKIEELGVIGFIVSSNLSLQELGNIVAGHFEKVADG